MRSDRVARRFFVRQWILTAVAAGLVTQLATRAATACPFCAAPSLTLAEQLSQSDAAVLVQWVKGTRPKDDKPGMTEYVVKQIVKAPKGMVKTDQHVKLTRFRAGKSGDLFFLMGSRQKTTNETIDWGSPLEVSETSFNYIAQAPSPEMAGTERLKYFMRFLEFNDPLVANDAYAEFANAPYKDIEPLDKIMPREKIRKWVLSKDTQATRLGLYGLLIGLCGTDKDADALAKKILEPTEDFRLGIDGVISGYLLLKGAKGLDLVDESKLRNKDVPFSETYAAMQALRFMWTYGNGRINKDRLRQSMRVLLDRPELADLVIADLARWKDLSVQDRLMDLYGKDEYNIPSIKRAIVRYMLVSTKDQPAGENTKTPKHVTVGNKHLKTLEKSDPKTVREAKRFFFLK